jgi:hypothetical protein
MIYRRAQSVEAPQLVDIIVDRHKDSRYADVCGVDALLARKILAHAIHRHGGDKEGATFVEVAADEETGQVEAFIFASLNRIYGFGDKLCASDNLLLARKDVSGFVLDRLLSRYVNWALGIPAVVEIGGSWNTTIEGSERFGRVFARRGFAKIGEIWTLMPGEAQSKGAVA